MNSPVWRFEGNELGYSSGAWLCGVFEAVVIPVVGKVGVSSGLLVLELSDQLDRSNRCLLLVIPLVRCVKTWEKSLSKLTTWID